MNEISGFGLGPGVLGFRFGLGAILSRFVDAALGTHLGK